MVDGIFACGNVLQVHDLVDFVSEESEIAGKFSADYVLNGAKAHDYVDTKEGENISYVLPQKIDKAVSGHVKLFFRVKNTFKDCTIRVKCGDSVFLERKKKIAVPGEMETLLITNDKLKDLNQTVVVELQTNS